MFSKLLKLSINMWASFVQKIAAKNFQKSPNLVTLCVSEKIFRALVGSSLLA